ncbi:MAG: glycosyltransferase family 9 protein, partial [Alphaproteobacteria bacterium]|nr:glycosyltransferase family 9 protein [Alphaproteobacteria bacterium]
HFAAITELPTIVLFGPETPRLYGSLGNTRALTANLACSPCVSAANHRRTACNDPKCMAAISPEQVLGEVASILDRR